MSTIGFLANPDSTCFEASSDDSFKISPKNYFWGNLIVCTGK
jgi:hypothetical protein